MSLGLSTIVKAWFTKEEIDTIMKSLPKVQTLTGRETEVFIEMLEGKIIFISGRICRRSY